MIWVSLLIRRCRSPSIRSKPDGVTFVTRQAMVVVKLASRFMLPSPSNSLLLLLVWKAK